MTARRTRGGHLEEDGEAATDRGCEGVGARVPGGVCVCV
jgi:hypothetical protein